MGRPIRRRAAAFSAGSESGAERKAEFAVANRARIGRKARRAGSARQRQANRDHAADAARAESRDSVRAGCGSAGSGSKSLGYRATCSRLSQSDAHQSGSAESKSTYYGTTDSLVTRQAGTVLSSECAEAIQRPAPILLPGSDALPSSP